MDHRGGAKGQSLLPAPPAPGGKPKEIRHAKNQEPRNLNRPAPRSVKCRPLRSLIKKRADREGHIELPAPRIKAVNNAIRHRNVRAESPLDMTPIEGPLQGLLPLEIRLVRRAEGEDLFAQLLRDHNYLVYSRPVGEHLKYLVLAGSRPGACLGWSSAPLKLDLRDRFVGAPKEAYRHRLHCIAYNSRYLILPWVRVPHLASPLGQGDPADRP
jgi:hypothetical protein